MLKSTTFEIIWATLEMIVGPPGEPVTNFTPPEASSRIVGLIDESIRFSGPTALRSPCTRPNRFGVPGFTAKSSISLFNRKPAPATVTRLPYSELIVVVTATALPLPSKME